MSIHALTRPVHVHETSRTDAWKDVRVCVLTAGSETCAEREGKGPAGVPGCGNGRGRPPTCVRLCVRRASLAQICRAQRATLDTLRLQVDIAVP